MTSRTGPVEERRRLAAQTEAIVSKDDLSRELAIHQIQDALRNAGFAGRRARSGDA